MVIEEAKQVYRLACLELRGGNQMGTYAVQLPGLDGWVSCRPLHPSPYGGDLYYMSACSHGIVARIVLADVSGHGEMISVAAIRLREALLQHIDNWDQSMLIRQLNDSLLKDSRQTGFATAFLASFYSSSGEMLFTNAGQMPPLWYRAAAKEWNFLIDTTPLAKEILDLPLGLIPGTSYSQKAVQLEPDDLLILYTDGINESRNQSGEQLGLDRLLSTARSVPTHSAESAGRELLLAVERFRGGVPATDDETVLALQVLSPNALDVGDAGTM
jgi:sigma-B regulation protein RsbU (phosphoserine phosphatase)